MVHRRMILSLALGVALSAAVASAQSESPDPVGPSGGGASAPFTGLAQAPEANLFAGAATTSIPIEVPPGRQHLTPHLALTYSSSAGPSPYGYGWDLPLGKIQRSTKHGVLSCTDPQAHRDFVLMLPAGTVECRLEDDDRCYPPVEEAFLRIHYRRQDNAWEVRDKSGLRYVFGGLESNRTGSNTATLFTPGTPCTYTFAWGLQSVTDANGNRLTIGYTAHDGVLYPRTVSYGGNSVAGLTALFRVDFVWSDDGGVARPAGDTVVSGLGGFRARVAWLLSRIDVQWLANGTWTPIRGYGFTYDFQLGADAPGRQSFLSAVTLYDGNDRALARADGAAAATTFLYRRTGGVTWNTGFRAEAQTAARPELSTPTWGRYTEIVQGDGAYGTGVTRRDLVDMNGDGIPDWVDAPHCDPVWRVYLGRPGGFDVQPTLWDATATWACSSRMYEWSGTSTKTKRELLDLTGDGIPDFVNAYMWSAANPTWWVHPGEHGPDGWRFGEPIAWPAPAGHIRLSRSNADFIGWKAGSADLDDLLDLNGDGLPDFVAAGGPSGWRVWRNTGRGFEPGQGTPFWAYYPVLRYTTDFGMQVIGVADMTGDGLPEQVAVSTGAWHVYVNQGHGLSWPADEWPVPASACSWWSGRAWNGLRQTLYRPGTDVVRDLFDINGDGLPDLVDTCGYSPASDPRGPQPPSAPPNPYWTVYLNRGGGFAAPIAWYSPSPLIRDLNDQNDHNGTGGITHRDTLDMDGDGLADFVDFQGDGGAIRIFHNRDGAWCPSHNGTTCTAGGSTVAANPTGSRPDMLSRFENGLGATTVLTYRPSTEPLWSNRLPFVLWVVARIEQDDGLCDDDGADCIAGGSHLLRTDLRYSYGRYEPMAREFRGFGTVESTLGTTLRRTYFRQDATRKGRSYFTEVRDGNRLLSATADSWECATPPGTDGGGQPADCPDALGPGERRWVRLGTAQRYAYTTTSAGVVTGNRAAFTQNRAWDLYGNVTESRAGGADTAAVTTSTTHAYNLAGYVVDKPTHVRIADGTATLEEKWFTYDGNGPGVVGAGNVTSVYSWLDQVGGGSIPGGSCPATPAAGTGSCVTTHMAYDEVGNMTTIVDANGNPTTTTYDPATRIHPYTVTNALNHRIATFYDPACGQRLWETIAYQVAGPAAPAPAPEAQAKTTYTYDSFCRLRSLRLPDEPASSPPQIQYTYTLGARRYASTVRIRRAEPAAVLTGGVVTREELYDALGRRLQSQRDAVVEGVWETVADGTVIYDPHGRPVTAYAPFTFTKQFHRGAARYAPPRGGTAVTSTAYDALGRVTRVTQPDGTFRTAEHGVAWQTTTRDECLTSGRCAGSTLIERRDAFGRTIEKQVYSGDTFVSRTGYTYDGLGRLTHTMQGPTLSSWNAATAITTTYDSLGRKIDLVDPDTGAAGSPGRWRYAYDRVGNLIREDDPKDGQHIELAYDQLGRLQRKDFVTTALAPSGSCTRTTISREPTRYYYGDSPHADDPWVPYSLGRLTRVDSPAASTIIRAYDVRGRVRRHEQQIIDQHGERWPAVFATEHDAAGHVTHLTYPDGETVRYGYDATGQVTSLRSTDSPHLWLISNATYDIFGRPKTLMHGNGVIDERTYHGASQNFRLATVRSRQGSATHLDLSYPSYTATGLLAQVTDRRDTSGARSNTATFTYTGLGQLSGVSGPNFPTKTYGAPADPLNCATSTKGYCYDRLGNITAKEGVRFTYSTTQPHTLAKIGNTAVSADANGNRLGAAAQHYDYTLDDRLTQITAGGTTVDLRYDHSGRQVRKLVGGGQPTLYYGPLLEARSGSLTKYYFAGGRRVAGRTVPSAQFAALASEPAVHLAGGSLQRPMLALGLRPDIAPGVAMIVLGAGVWLCVAPWRRKRVVGIAVRYGQVVLVIVTFCAGTLPWPLVIVPRPAAAQETASHWHYHVDHLGSTQVLTNPAGGVVREIRYRPYGQIRHTTGTGGNAYEFTGYETDAISGLQYAGARYYDPSVGQFLTHDPASRS